MTGRSSANTMEPLWSSLTVSMAQGQAVIPTTSTPMVFFSGSEPSLTDLASILKVSSVFFPLGPGRSVKYSADMLTSAYVAYSCFCLNLWQISAATTSIPWAGVSRVELITSLIASRLRERCDPFWVGGRSTNTSILQNKVVTFPVLDTLMGFLTLVTPTRVRR